MAYKPISDYGVIGDMRSAALVSRDGSIDWLCFPRFDSPSVFAALLDHEKGGRFQMRPAGDFSSHQAYVTDTNVLRTQFEASEGRLLLTDFMPSVNGHGGAGSALVRHLRCESGSVDVAVDYEPRLDYARGRTELTVTDGGTLASNGDQVVSLATDLPLKERDGGLHGIVRLRAGESAGVTMRWGDERPAGGTAREAAAQMEETAHFWRSLSDDWGYTGRWAEMVNRSMLALHLLIYEPTGAVCAAATTSLPERIGGGRNWDYRFSWLRDAAFTMDAFHRLGHTAYTRPFVDWMTRSTANDSEHDVHSLSGIGQGADPHAMTEYTLTHLEGYRGSGPVRIGNAAYYQFQLDVYGEVVLALDSYQRAGGEVDDTMWQLTQGMVERALANWRRPDHGIWEFRTEPRHFTYSKLMAWAAVDRGLRMALALRRPVDFSRWEKAREEIREDILANGWNRQRGSFVQSYGGRNVDASLLFIPMIGFLPPDDVRVLATIETVQRELGGNGLLRRYNPDEAQDGISGDEGTFTMCSFWLAGSLLAAGRVAQAREVFEKVIGYAGPLGLYSEMLDPATGEYLGNYPQAFTHIGLIHTARNLDRALDAADQGKTVAA
jgi:GH15 family glucan-1,4-alpha-glucosidase